jgi:hypothetical protein
MSMLLHIATKQYFKGESIVSEDALKWKSCQIVVSLMIIQTIETIPLFLILRWKKN